MTAIIVALINLLGTIFVFFANKKISKLKDLEVKLDQKIRDNGDLLQKQINEVRKAVDNVNIGNIRARIVTFDNICRLDEENNSIQRHQYDAIFKDIDEWSHFHEIYPELNGEINVAIENIKQHFKEAKF